VVVARATAVAPAVASGSSSIVACPSSLPDRPLSGTSGGNGYHVADWADAGPDQVRLRLADHGDRWGRRDDAEYSLPACTSADGCFTKVDASGGTKYRPVDNGWAFEMSIDAVIRGAGIVANATSHPEGCGGASDRNWDYPALTQP
jgi:hypothetical protein